MNLKYPHLLWPAFRLQYRVQEVSLSLSQWKASQRKMKEKREDELNRAPRRSSLCSCFRPPPPPAPPSAREDSGVSHSSRRHDPSRKLNPDRIKRKDSKGRKLSVMTKSRKSRAQSRSSMASEEHSGVGRASRGQSTRLRRQDTHTQGPVYGRSRPSTQAGKGTRKLSSPMHWASHSEDQDQADEGTVEEGSQEEREEEEKTTGTGASPDDAPSPPSQPRLLTRAGTLFNKSTATVHPSPGTEQGKVAGLRGSAYASQPDIRRQTTVTRAQRAVASRDTKARPHNSLSPTCPASPASASPPNG
jgi:hypothetical protein